MLNDFSVDEFATKSAEYIENCELADCDHGSHSPARMMAFDVDKKAPEAMVVNDTITSIASGMSQRNKNIIKDSLLFASLVANAKKAHSVGGVEWYQEYRRALTFCGWTPTKSDMTKYTVSHSRFTMEQVALEILQSAIVAAALPGPTSVMLLKVAKDTVDALQKNDKPLRLFESRAKTRPGADFAIATAAESSDGEVVMVMGALDFRTHLNVTNVLFWEWSSSLVSIMSAGNHFMLNAVHYGRVADTVELKLTESARRALEAFDF